MEFLPYDYNQITMFAHSKKPKYLRKENVNFLPSLKNNYSVRIL